RERISQRGDAALPYAAGVRREGLPPGVPRAPREVQGQRDGALIDAAHPRASEREDGEEERAPDGVTDPRDVALSSNVAQLGVRDVRLAQRVETGEHVHRADGHGRRLEPDELLAQLGLYRIADGRGRRDGHR